MKTMSRSIAVASLAMLVWACGGKTFGDSDGGGSGDDIGPDSGASEGGGGDSGMCKPLPGCTSPTSCRAPDGCNECSCVGGEWACTDLGCFDASVMCPVSPPDVGAPCQGNGLTCAFGTQCGPEFVCRNNSWGMVIRTCPPPPPTCPSSPPSGSCNGSVGLSCSWGMGCNMETCDCVATPGGPSWICSGTACVDAGHTGDSGH